MITQINLFKISPHTCLLPPNLRRFVAVWTELIQHLFDYIPLESVVA